MPWLKCKKFFVVLVFIGINGFALGGADGFYHIAAPAVLPHSAYQIFG